MVIGGTRDGQSPAFRYGEAIVSLCERDVAHGRVVAIEQDLALRMSDCQMLAGGLLRG